MLVCKKKSINFIQSDLFQSVKGKFNVIISNPPFVAQNKIKNEPFHIQYLCPRVAIDGGKNGCSIIKPIILNSYKYLNYSGFLILMIEGNHQLKFIREIVEKSSKYKILEVANDHKGIERVIVLKKGTNIH